MRIRTIKPEFWRDRKLTAMGPHVQLLYIGCWNMADDYGIILGDIQLIKSDIFPFSGDEILPDLEIWIQKLVDGNMIFPFEIDGEKYFYIRTFHLHQKIDRPSKKGHISAEKIAKHLDLKFVPLTFDEYSSSVSRAFDEYSLLERKGKDREQGTGNRETAGKNFPAPEKIVSEILPEQEKEKKDPPVAPDPPEKDFIDQVVELYQRRYKVARNRPYSILTRGKERDAAGRLLKHLKILYPNARSDDMLVILSEFFDQCLAITEEWFFKNMTIPIIASKFNEINAYINEPERKTSGQPRTSNAELADVFARSYASRPG